LLGDKRKISRGVVMKTQRVEPIDNASVNSEEQSSKGNYPAIKATTRGA
jgi:hypothetical protein